MVHSFLPATATTCNIPFFLISGCDSRKWLQMGRPGLLPRNLQIPRVQVNMLRLTSTLCGLSGPVGPYSKISPCYRRPKTLMLQPWVSMDCDISAQQSLNPRGHKVERLCICMQVQRVRRRSLGIKARERARRPSVQMLPVNPAQQPHVAARGRKRNDFCHRWVPFELERS